ncbi:flagellar basal body-associated FliL family protein [Marinospirillum alkaliphilum]|uniref:Flagellar protein FliL n=1 Tax=Marinospirillum alkaliphilum DSM 21637 TaxID=1122209 RepID=A0A1K1X0Z8_9GAMM|nr:flagellar basal body-associated FliL family protein [Marinospirillum alkaliphilum]SFX43353.1 Flagellar basal body-associated protein FliL [Marinospirillum alkaliphilum DSM 21637]
MSEKTTGKSRKILFMGITALALILVVVLAIFGTLKVKDRLPGTGSDFIGAGGPLGDPRIRLNTSFYYSFEEPFVVPMGGSSRRQSFLRVSLAVKVEDQRTAQAIERHSPLIRSRINLMLREMTRAELQTPEGKQQLQVAAARVIRDVMGPDPLAIDGVLITDFVLQ